MNPRLVLIEIPSKIANMRYKKVIDDDKESYIAHQLLGCAQMCNDLDDKMSLIKEYLE